MNLYKFWSSDRLWPPALIALLVYNRILYSYYLDDKLLTILQNLFSLYCEKEKNKINYCAWIVEGCWRIMWVIILILISIIIYNFDLLPYQYPSLSTNLLYICIVIGISIPIVFSIIFLYLTNDAINFIEREI